MKIVGPYKNHSSNGTIYWYGRELVNGKDIKYIFKYNHKDLWILYDDPSLEHYEEYLYKEEAMQVMDKRYVDSGYIIIDDEVEFEKLKLLL